MQLAVSGFNNHSPGTVKAGADGQSTEALFEKALKEQNGTENATGNTTNGTEENRNDGAQKGTENTDPQSGPAESRGGDSQNHAANPVEPASASTDSPLLAGILSVFGFLLLKGEWLVDTFGWVPVIVALLLFFMPFIKIGHNESTMAGKDSKPLIVLTGKEMIVGIDDDNSAKDKSKSDFQNIRIITAAILLGVSIFMTQGAGITSAISAGLLFFYMRGAENSYKYGNKTIKEWDGLLKIHFQPALYAVLILAIVGAVLAGIDQVKRRKMFQQEQEFSPFGGYM